MQKKIQKSQLPCTDGITLLELVIVVSIIAVLLTFSFPALGSLRQNLLLRNGARRVASLVRLARVEALNSGDTVRVTFDRTNNRILYRRGSDPTQIHLLPQGVRIAGTNFPNNRLHVFSSGTPDRGGTVTLNSLDRYLYAIVTPVTARVRISDTPPW